MTIYPDCQTCNGTGKVIVPEGRSKVTIGFFDYTSESACPRCKKRSDEMQELRHSVGLSDITSAETRWPIKLSIEHSDIIEPASKAFWEACRTDLGRAVLACNDMWRDPVEEFEKVREAVRKGMRAAMKVANEMQHRDT